MYTHTPLGKLMHYNIALLHEKLTNSITLLLFMESIALHYLLFVTTAGLNYLFFNNKKPKS